MRRPQPLWFGLLALAGAAVLNLNVDDATLSLEADDATDIDAYVASLSLPRLEGAGCAANDAPCVRKVVADALRAAVEDEAPPTPPHCEANATTSVRLAPKIAGLAAPRCDCSREAERGPGRGRLGGGSRSGWRRGARRGAGRFRGAWKRRVGRTHGFRGSRARADGVGLRRCGRGFYQCIPRRRSF